MSGGNGEGFGSPGKPQAGPGPPAVDSPTPAAVAAAASCLSHRRSPIIFPCRLDFGSKPIERQLILSAQFLHNELPVRLSHRVAELENLPYGLSAKTQVLKVSALQQHSARAVQGRENSQRYTAGLGQRSGQQCSLPPSRQATR